MSMKVISSMAAMQRQGRSWIRSGESVGFVPTMGALHEGHLKLIKRARQECKRVVVSIYVNPTQFGPKEDLARYPRPRRQDLAMCRQAGADCVFCAGKSLSVGSFDLRGGIGCFPGPEMALPVPAIFAESPPWC